MKKESRNTVGPIGIALLVGSLIIISYIAYRGSSNSPEELDTLKRIELTGVVRIGYANEAPYGYLDSKSGEITGEAPEIAKVILSEMGAKEIVPVVTEFGSLIPGLKAGRFDVIAAGMYITPARAKEISFSNPTYAIGESFLVAAGNPLNLNSFESVASHPEARLGVMGGSVEHGYAKDLNVPEDRIVIFPDYPSAVDGLKTDRVEAVAATILTANDLLRKAQSDKIQLADNFENPVIDGNSIKGYGAFGFRKKDDELREEFNRHLADFIGSKEHLDLVRPFGFVKETLPGDVSVEELSQPN